MGWSAGSAPQPFIMGTVLPLLLPFNLSLWLCVVGWGRGWEGYYCTTVIKIQYLHYNPLFSNAFTFFWEKYLLWIYPLWIWSPAVNILIKFHWIWLDVCISSYPFMGRLSIWLVMGGTLVQNGWMKFLTCQVEWCSLSHLKIPLLFSTLLWVLKINIKLPTVASCLFDLCEQMLECKNPRFHRLELIVWSFSCFIKCKFIGVIFQMQKNNDILR